MYVVMITRDTRQRKVARWRDFRGWKNSKRLTKLVGLVVEGGLRETKEGR
jgi:hypothetical protein